MIYFVEWWVPLKLSLGAQTLVETTVFYLSGLLHVCFLPHLTVNVRKGGEKDLFGNDLDVSLGVRKSC